MSLFRRAAPPVPARVTSVSVLVTWRGGAWRVASGYTAGGAAPSWEAECPDGDLEATLAVALPAAFGAAAHPHVDSERWFAGDPSVPATQAALEDAALDGARFFTVTLGPRGCVAVRYLLSWPLIDSDVRRPLLPGHPENGTAAYFEQYRGWGATDLAGGRYAEPLGPVVAWLREARGDDPRVAAFYEQSVDDPRLPLMALLPERAKATVTSLLGDTDAIVDDSGPRRLGLPDPGVAGRWRMLLHWDPLRGRENRDAVAGHVGIVVTADGTVRWFYWPADGSGPQSLGYRGRSAWTTAQRQIVVRMVRELVAAGGVPQDWDRGPVR